jgi:hypothetical protein
VSSFADLLRAIIAITKVAAAIRNPTPSIESLHPLAATIHALQ